MSHLDWPSLLVFPFACLCIWSIFLNCPRQKKQMLKRKICGSRDGTFPRLFPDTSQLTSRGRVAVAAAELLGRGPTSISCTSSAAFRLGATLLWHQNKTTCDFFSSPRIRGITDAKQCFFLSLRPHKAHLCTFSSMINFLTAHRRSLRSLVTSNSQICTFGKLYPFWDPSPTNKGKYFISSLITYTLFCQAFLTDIFLALSSSKYLLTRA